MVTPRGTSRKRYVAQRRTARKLTRAQKRYLDTFVPQRPLYPKMVADFLQKFPRFPKTGCRDFIISYVKEAKKAARERSLGLVSAAELKKKALKAERDKRLTRWKGAELSTNSSTCSWPIGHPGERGFRFCGEPRVGGRKSSYCSQHHAEAHVSGAPTTTGSS